MNTLPPTATPARRAHPVLLVLAVVLVAASLRPAITSVGPLLADISADTGIPLVALGLISSVPLVTWALVSPFAHDLSRRFGLSRTMSAALVVLFIGTILRSLPGAPAWLWVGTLFIGAALAIGNVLMPAAIKRDFPTRVPLMMGVYSALFGLAGAIASGVAVPIAHAPVSDGTFGWAGALLVIGAVLVPPALLVWWWATRRDAPPAGQPRTHARTAVWRDRVAWTVAGYMGMQASTFFILVTWIPTISTSSGRSAATGGIDVMIYQIFSIVGSLALPLVLRGAANRWVPAALPVLGLAGIAGLAFAPDAIVVWVSLLGAFSGASLGMSLTLMAQRARDTDAATALSGMSQAVGYAITAVGPVVFGALFAATGAWFLPLAFLACAMLGQCIVGLAAGRPRFILTP